MNTSQASALNFLLAQSIVEVSTLPVSAEPVVIGRSLTPKVKRSKKGAKAERAIAEATADALQFANQKNTAPAPTCLALPEAGSLSPQEFIVAMRRAKNRDEQVRAIAGYTGYSSTELFGTQEMNARLSANRAITPHKTLNFTMPKEEHNAWRSVAGTVAGMPDDSAKRLANLQAQERETTEERCKWIAEYNNEGLSWADRITAKGLFDVAGERLESIRKDIASLTF
jgi:hypothetical protein